MPNSKGNLPDLQTIKYLNFFFFLVLNSCLFSTVVERENAYIDYQTSVFFFSFLNARYPKNIGRCKSKTWRKKKSEENHIMNFL